MARSVNSAASRARRKKVLKMAKGYFGRRKNNWTVAKNTVEKGLTHAYRHRKEKKRNFRRLWIARINAAVRAEGLSYSKFMDMLHKSGLDLNRKVLADLALNQPESFKAIVARLNADNNNTSTQPAVSFEVKKTSLVEKVAVAAATVSSTQKDNLRKIEGIGPAIERLLNAAGIETFSQLSETSVERLENILSVGGPSFAIHKPDTWPRQAAMAAEGRWDELKAWQDELDGGKEV